MRRTVILVMLCAMLLGAYLLSRRSTLTPKQAALPDFGTTTVSLNGVQNAAAREQFLEAYQAGEPARWEAIAYTIEGDPIYHHLLYNGNGTQLEVVYDTRQGLFKRGRVDLYTCEGLVEDDRFLELTNCSTRGSDQITLGIPIMP